MRFFKKIQDWILKSERIRKRIVCFFTQQINPRSFGSRCPKGAEESTPRVDSSVPLIHHDPRDLGLICLVKKRKIRFRILLDLRIQSWIFFKETHPKFTSTDQGIRRCDDENRAMILRISGEPRKILEHITELSSVVFGGISCSFLPYSEKQDITFNHYILSS